MESSHFFNFLTTAMPSAPDRCTEMNGSHSRPIRKRKTHSENVRATWCHPKSSMWSQGARWEGLNTEQDGDLIPGCINLPSWGERVIPDLLCRRTCVQGWMSTAEETEVWLQGVKWSFFQTSAGQQEGFLQPWASPSKSIFGSPGTSCGGTWFCQPQKSLLLKKLHVA